MVHLPVGWQRTQSVILVFIISANDVLPARYHPRSWQLIAGVDLVVARRGVAGRRHAMAAKSTMIQRERVLECCPFPPDGRMA